MRKFRTVLGSDRKDKGPTRPRKWYFDASGSASNTQTPRTVFTCYAHTLAEALEIYNKR